MRGGKGLLLHGTLTSLIVALLAVSPSSKPQEYPTVEATMSEGSIVCHGIVVPGDGDWYLENSLTLWSPSGRVFFPTCGNSGNNQVVFSSATLETDDWTRPGLYKCSNSAHGMSPYGGWNGSADGHLMYENVRCICTPTGANFAVIYQPTIAFYVDIPQDSYWAALTEEWLEQGRQWWNNWLSSSVGSSRQIQSGYGWPIELRTLPGDERMRFTNEDGFRILIDPRVFEYGYDHARTLLAHELGHSLGVMGHSGCGESQSIMAAQVNSAHPGLYDADKCWAWGEYRQYTLSCGY